MANELKPELKVPKVLVNGGMRFQSQGAGTSNTLSGYILAPIHQSERGNVLFIDGFANWNFGGELSESNLGASTRLGYRWLNNDRSWIFGANAGADTTPYQGNYNWQAGVGLEALNKNVEIRLNGYIPLSNSNKEISRGFNSGYLSNNNLYLNAYQNWITSFGGLDLEVGTPVAKWGNGGLWLYAGYRYLDATVSNGPNASGLNARAEARIENNLAVGASYSYDDIFKSKVTGYFRYGSQPINRDAAAEVYRAENELLARRGLPVERESDVRISKVYIESTKVAKNPATGNAWVIRCVGTNNIGNNCLYNNIIEAVNAGSSDVMLMADGYTTNLNGGSLAIPAGLFLSNGANAPALNTQYGLANLSTIYGIGNPNTLPSITNGTLTVASNTTISGFAFTNASITNRSTSNLVISNNSFTGSADGNGAINLDGVTNVTISGNTITNPTASALTWVSTPYQTNDAIATSSQIARGISVKNSDNVKILNNTISNAIGEGIYIQDIGSSASNLIQGNTIQGMRVDINDSNLEAGIFVANNKSGYIRINGNTVKDNNQAVVTSGARTRTNASDGIEINVCRDGANVMNAVGLATVSGSPCSTATTFTADITNNTITNLRTAADGIDTSVGTNGNLILTATGNIVEKVGDEAFTFDSFGKNSSATLYIANNTFKSTGEKQGSTDGITITLHEYNALNKTGTSGTDAPPTVAYNDTNSNYNITIENNIIAANTENLNTTEKDKAEGIKFTIAQGLPSGSVNLVLAIRNNTVTTKNGEAIEIAATESAAAPVIFKSDIMISNNSLTITDTSGTKDVVALGIAKSGTSSTANVSYSLTGNTIVSSAPLGGADAIDLSSSSINTSSNIQFNISGNNLAGAVDKDLKINVALGGAFGIVAPVGNVTIGNFQSYLDSINRSANTLITPISRNPAQINSLTNFVE